MSFAQRLKHARKLRKMTCKELGIKLGFKENQAHSRISQYETGRKYPKKEMIDAIADILEINPDYLRNDDYFEIPGLIRMIGDLGYKYDAKFSVDKNNFTISLPRNNDNVGVASPFLMELVLISEAAKTNQISKEEYENFILNMPNGMRLKYEVVMKKLKNLDISIDIKKDKE